MKTLKVLEGPTAVGKTALAIEWALADRTEIVSADSRQFYRELDIGVARPSPEELAAVPHHFIACKSIEEYYSVSRYEQEALALLEELFKKHDVVILAGGSGLYVNALCHGIDDLPDPAPELREALKKQLAEEGIPVRLAVSLHAPSDELRDELVPMNKRFNTKQVLDAAHDYYLASKRRVSIEYALMRGINDQAEHAKLLAKRLNHYGDDWAHVNPIPLNPIEGSKWTASKPEDERRFLEILHNAGITATLRDTRGQDIDGACGQLAAKERD